VRICFFGENEADEMVHSGVPGELRGLEYLHKNYGVLSWSTVLAPAIKLARYGFPVSFDLLKFMQFSTKDYDFLTYDPSWAVDFAPNGTRVGLGDILTRKRYANTLETIAEHGADVFYTGAMANATVRAVNAANGSITMEDFENYKVISRPAIEINYRDKFRVVTCGAPASGAVVLSTLKVVEGYGDFGTSEMLNLSTHHLDEAIRFGYGEVMPCYKLQTLKG
jgi:gamma-glutamyltranspeptidase/glutathione hydrolase